MPRHFLPEPARSSGTCRTSIVRWRRPLSIAALAGVAALISCHDFSTAPDLRSPERPRLDLSTEPQWGRNSSPNSGSWTGEVDASWDGHAPMGPGWYFPYKTIIVVNTSGTVSQQAGGFPATGIVWKPWGRAGSDGLIGGAIGLQITNSSGGSAVWWPANADSTADTVSKSTIAVRYQARPFRDAVRDPQPDQGPVEYNCGRSSNPRWPCYTYPGTAQLSFTRPHVGLTMTKSGPTHIRPDSIVTFTAGMTVTTIAGLAVDMSEVRWRWVSDAPASGDTLTCESAAGLSCSHRIVSSGVMYLSAYVNGEQQQQSIQITVDQPRCKDIPGLAGQFPPLADPNVEQGLKDLWNSSKYSSDPLNTSRREMGAYIILNPDGVTYRVEPFTYNSVVKNAPCWTQAPMPPPGTVMTVHSHPFSVGDSYSACGENKAKYKNSDGSWGDYPGTPSDGDYLELKWIFDNKKNADGTSMNLDGLILDNDGMITYDLTDLVGGPGPGKPKVPGHRQPRCAH